MTERYADDSWAWENEDPRKVNQVWIYTDFFWLSGRNYWRKKVREERMRQEEINEHGGITGQFWSIWAPEKRNEKGTSGEAIHKYGKGRLFVTL